MSIRNLINSHCNGSTFVAIDTETEVILRGGKQNPLNGRVRKVMTGANVMVFTNKYTNAYDAMVRRRLEKEGKDPNSFVLSERKWGTRLTGEPFVEHKGKLYLEVIFLRPGKVTYYVDGVETDPSEIQGLEPKQEAEQGGLDNKVIIRTFCVENIKAITIDRMRVEFK